MLKPSYRQQCRKVIHIYTVIIDNPAVTKTEEQNRVEDLIGLRVIQQTINPHVLQNELCKQLILMFYRIMQLYVKNLPGDWL